MYIQEFLFCENQHLESVPEDFLSMVMSMSPPLFPPDGEGKKVEARAVKMGRPSPSGPG